MTAVSKVFLTGLFANTFLPQSWGVLLDRFLNCTDDRPRE
jgi:hypothetical protein